MVNPFNSPSTLPFQLPDYASITDAHVREALETGMTEHLEELRVIGASSEPATAQNVLHAWERSGATLTRTLSAFWVAKAADTNDERDAIMADFMPRLAQHQDAILLNTALYARLAQLRDRAAAGEVELDEQDEFNLAERLRDFERSGITLPAAEQERLKELNTELASLSNTFDKLLVDGRNAASVHVTDESRLVGVSADDLAGMREAARSAGLDGWLVTITNTTGQPVLDVIEDRALREQIYRASIDRGLSGEFDTRDVLVRIARLRAERAALLGYPHHAASVHEGACARTTEAVNALLGQLAPGVLRIAEGEMRQLAERAHTVSADGVLEPWDWQFLASRAKGDSAPGGVPGHVGGAMRAEEVKPYLEYTRVLHDGVFAAATALYGITFHERPELVGYTSEATVYEVREADGIVLGAVVIDPYTRPTKQGGAWMTSIVEQSHLLGDLPLVTNTCNLTPPAPGSPSLMTWDNVITLFHEFGHDLHGLLSDVRYPSRSGANVPRDFVEFPSQVNEIWAFEPALIRRFARHHETGEEMPQEWIDALVGERGKTGYDAIETITAMILDQAWHQASLEELPADGSGVEEFEARALDEAGVAFPLVPPRYRSAYFHHVFGGGYSAAYYSYIWSEVMDADTVAWFREQATAEQPGGMTRAAGEHFRRELLGRGGSIEALETYRRFRGSDPDVTHLLARMGLAD